MSRFSNLVSYISRKNIKTGACGSVQIGSTTEDTFRSCKCAKCPLLPTLRIKKEDGKTKILKGNYIKTTDRKKLGKTNRISEGFEFLKSCYAHSGMVATAAKSLNKAYAKNPNRYSIQNMFDSMTWKMKFVRIGTIGDPCTANPADFDQIRKLAKERGKVAFGYTHGWDRPNMEKQADLLRASCMTIDRVKKALNKGFKASLVVPHGKGEKIERTMNIDGVEGRVCDFYSDEYLQGKKNVQKTDCSTCLKCDPKTGPDLIIFPSHK